MLLKKIFFDYDFKEFGYPLEPNLWDSLSFFIMQITPALSYNDLLHMKEDTFFAYYHLSKEKNDREAEELEKSSKDKEGDEPDFIGEEDDEAVDFFESITGYND